MKFFFLRADVANYFFSRSFFPTDVLALLLYWKKVSFCVESRIIVISLLPFPGTRQTTEAEFCLFAFCAITQGAMKCAFVRQLTRKESLHSSLSMTPDIFLLFFSTHTRAAIAHTKKDIFFVEEKYTLPPLRPATVRGLCLNGPPTPLRYGKRRKGDRVEIRHFFIESAGSRIAGIFTRGRILVHGCVT